MKQFNHAGTASTLARNFVKGARAKKSVILSAARRKVMLSATSGSERSRRTSWILSEMTEADLACSMKSRPAALSRRHLAVRSASAWTRVSETTGSCPPFLPKYHFALTQTVVSVLRSAMALPRQVRSQVQLGNEEGIASCALRAPGQQVVRATQIRCLHRGLP